MTNFSIPKVRLILLTVSLGVLPLGCAGHKLAQGCTDTLANNNGCVQITRWVTDGDKVTLRVKVLNEFNAPLADLKPGNFQVETQSDLGIRLPPIKPSVILPKSPGAKATPADVVILLDMSGSMKHEDSSPTQRRIKLKGAISAIEKFIEAVNQEPNLTVRISLAPLGYGCYNENSNFQVTPQSIEKNFLPSTEIELSDSKLKTQLDRLARVDVCASTDLYRPLETAINYLRSESTPTSNSSSVGISNETSSKQLVVILLSDGFHNYERETEEQQFDKLRDLLRAEPRVTVHTLGYGESLSEVYNDSNCTIQLTKEQLTEDEVIQRDIIIDKIIKNCQRRDNPRTFVNESRIGIDEFIVDQPRLKEIAKLTGGIHQFPDNAEQVAQSLITFLETLREYQLTYQQPGADRASQHQTTVRIIPNNVTSNTVAVRMCNIGCPPLRLPERLAWLVGMLILFGIVGVLPFVQWSKKLYKER